MRRLKPKKKISTIFALTLILIALGLGLGLYYYQESFNQKKKIIYKPQNIEVVNFSPTSLSFTWQTDVLTRGEVLFGENESSLTPLNDDRDFKNISARTTHFISARNLKPDTKYFYQIKNEDQIFPQQAIVIKTPPKFPEISMGKSNQDLYQPISGTVTDLDLKPVDEALVFLKIEGTKKLGTFINGEGNFLIPLKDLYTEDLKVFELKKGTTATLELIKGNVHSTVDFLIPPENQTLSALPLGRNLNLRDYPILKPEEDQAETSPKNKYDLNSDGKINSVDLSIVLDSINKNSKNPKVDLNSDGVLDQKDIEALQSAITLR